MRMDCCVLYLDTSVISFVKQRIGLHLVVKDSIFFVLSILFCLCICWTIKLPSFFVNEWDGSPDKFLFLTNEILKKTFNNCNCNILFLD